MLHDVELTGEVMEVKDENLNRTERTPLIKGTSCTEFYQYSTNKYWTVLGPILCVGTLALIIWMGIEGSKSDQSNDEPEFDPFNNLMVNSSSILGL